jgi:RNA recognition motif-containing protein
VQACFERFSRPRAVRVTHDTGTGRAPGCAYVEFASVDDARQAMEYPHVDRLELGGRRLVLEYARSEHWWGGARRLGGKRNKPQAETTLDRFALNPDPERSSLTSDSPNVNLKP